LKVSDAARLHLRAERMASMVATGSDLGQSLESASLQANLSSDAKQL
jgi:hypothetical protein